MHRDPHRFLDALRTQSPAALEEDALQCPNDTRASYRLTAAAERIFLRDSCAAVVQSLSVWRPPCIFDVSPGYIARWHQILECLPQHPHPGSSAETFYAAQREELAGNKAAALQLYLEASTKHPLAAARAACLGGRRSRLAGWRRFTGKVDSLVLGLQFQALMLDKLGIALIGEAPLTEEERTQRISEADWQVGLLAGRLSVLFGCLETALYLLTVLGEHGHSLTLPYVAYASLNNIHAAAYLRGFLAHCLKLAPLNAVTVPYELHDRFFIAEGQYLAYPWAGLPFCDAPRPSNLFAANRALDLAVDVLERLHICIPTTPGTVRLTIDPLHIDYREPRYTENHNRWELMLTCVHQREQPRREDCSFIPKFRTPDISVTLHRSIEPWTRSFSQPENAHKLSCLHHRHPLVDSGTILTHLTESSAPFWWRLRVRSLEVSVCLQCSDRGSKTTWPQHSVPPSIAGLCDQSIQDPLACRLWKLALLVCVRTWSNGHVMDLTAFDAPPKCDLCGGDAARACWIGNGQQTCIECMLPLLATTAGLDIQGFVGLLCDILVGRDPGHSALHWQLLAGECVAMLSGDACITAAQWAQIVACFRLVCTPTTQLDNLFPPLIWLLSQPWFYGNASAAEAEAIVAKSGAVPGTWLLRFSSSERGGFAFTSVASDGRILHYRVSRGDGAAQCEYVLRLKGRDVAYGGLRELVVGACRELDLSHALLTSPLRLTQARFIHSSQLDPSRRMFDERFKSEWPLSRLQ